jgi:hypothetical protein
MSHECPTALKTPEKAFAASTPLQQLNVVSHMDAKAVVVGVLRQLCTWMLHQSFYWTSNYMY